jgi:paired amphipathic helix protein Sin3a
MHRVEDQRLEYDSFIDANLHIIALLEPVAQQLETMSEDDKTDFRLPSVFGPSKSIYQRIIRQVYGKDKGSAIVKRLHDCPAQVVPVLLSRLKERNIQWKQKQVKM